MSDEAKPYTSEECASARHYAGASSWRRVLATVRALEAERAKTSEMRHLLARALRRLRGGHEPGITNDIEEVLNGK